MDSDTPPTTSTTPTPTNHNESILLAEEQMRMASERTFLAWIRTGLTSVGIGIAIAKFILFRSAVHKTTGKWSGLLLILWGIGIFIFALMSYGKSYRKLRLFKMEKHPLIPLTIITTALVLISIALFILILE